MSSYVLIVSIRLDGESEEVEARVVGDEDRVETVPAVVGVSHLESQTSYHWLARLQPPPTVFSK